MLLIISQLYFLEKQKQFETAIKRVRGRGVWGPGGKDEAEAEEVGPPCAHGCDVTAPL